MPLAIGMQKPDCFARDNEQLKHIQQPCFKIFKMVTRQVVDDHVQPLAPNDFENPDQIFRFVVQGKTMHETGIVLHEIENAGFLGFTPKTPKRHGTDMLCELFVKDQFQNG